MNNQNHILFSYAFDELGKCRKLENKDIATEMKNEGLAWTHLDANHPSTKGWIKKNFDYLDHLIIDALTAEETRPRIIEFDDGLLLIFRGVGFGKDANSQEMVSVRMWIDHDRVITIQKRDMKAVYDIRQNIESGKEIKNSSEFLYNLLYQILFDISLMLYEANDKLDDLEDKIMTTHDIKFREEILQIRTQSAVFKRYLFPQREVISKLGASNLDWISDWTKRHFQENFDKINHMIEEVGEAINRSQILHDELANALSEKLNRSMYRLSLITVIFMPLTFIAGLFGMNVGGIPGNTEPLAFYICSATMLVIAALQILFFKKRDWF